MSSTQLGVSSGVPACGKGLDKQHSPTLSRTTSPLPCLAFLICLRSPVLCPTPGTAPRAPRGSAPRLRGRQALLSRGWRARSGFSWQAFCTHRLQTTKAAAQNLSGESPSLKPWQEQPCLGAGGDTEPPPGPERKPHAGTHHAVTLQRPALFSTLHNNTTKRQIPVNKGGKMG